MSEVSVRHDTVVVRRSYDAEVDRVFHAWTDPQALARWYTPGDDGWSAKILDHDFRVGGRKWITFGPAEGPPFFEDCRYEDIVPGRRLCYSMRIARGDVPITVSMVTVELVPRRQRTEVVVTDQIVILDGGDTASDRERGWGETLAKLGPEVAPGT